MVFLSPPHQTKLWRGRPYSCVLILYILSLNVLDSHTESSSSQVESNGKDLVVTSGSIDSCKGEKWCASLDEAEALALDAIRSLHRQLDDDRDGNIDLTETKDFLTEELKYEKNVENRQKAFHLDDTQVSVQELWETWIKSEVHNWTVDQTVDWLITFVGLPQHQDKFTARNINGTVLPILAVNHNNFLQAQLGVKDSITRQRIAVKAMDVVLFGPPRDTTNRIKDVILTTLLALAVIACYMVYKRYQWAQDDLSKMSKHMAELSKAEETLLDLQRELEKAKTQEKKEAVVEGKSSNIQGDDPDEVAKLREENMILRSELHRAEVELQDKCWVPPPALQHWLQYTYELELKTYNKKKVGAEKQLKQAKEACDKLKKKRSSLMGAFVTTHGRSIDDVDKAILEARTALTEITHELQERMHRWKQVELLIGCSIMNNPGIQYLENLLKVYGKPQYAAGPGSVISNSQDDIDDDATSSIYCPSAVHKLIGSSAFLMFPATAGHQNYSCIPSAYSTSAHLFSFHPDYLAALAAANVSSANGRSGHVVAPTENPLNHSDLTTISEESVSGPTSHLQLSMARSKSSSSMLSLRERERGLISRDSSSKDSSNGEDDFVVGDASDITNARRVTFRADHRSRMKAYSNGRANGSSLFDSMDNEEARRIVSRALSQTNSEHSLESLTSNKPEEGVQGWKKAEEQSDIESSLPIASTHLEDLSAPPTDPCLEFTQPHPPSPPITAQKELQNSSDPICNPVPEANGTSSATFKPNGVNGHVSNGAKDKGPSTGVPIEAMLQYSSPTTTKVKGGKLWSTISKLVHHKDKKGDGLEKQKGHKSSTLTLTKNGLGASTMSVGSKRSSATLNRRFTGMFSSLRKYSDKTGDVRPDSKINPVEAEI